MIQHLYILWLIYISLVNNHYHTYTNFFLVMRTFKIYSLNNFQICNSVLLTIVIKLYIASPWLIYFISRYLYLLTIFIHFTHPPPPLATTNLFSVSMFSFSVLFLDSTYKWHHMAFVFAWLILFRIIPSRFIHIVTHARFLLYCGWIIYAVYIYSIYTLYSIYNHIFFIHSPSDEDLGCFHVLVIVNNASMNIEEGYIFFLINVFTSFK